MAFIIKQLQLQLTYIKGWVTQKAALLGTHKFLTVSNTVPQALYRTIVQQTTLTSTPTYFFWFFWFDLIVYLFPVH